MTADSENQEVDPRQVEAFEPLPGDLLVSARRSRGMSISKAAVALNLDESVVLALEENRFADLGAPVFARGHLRKYARLLGLNADDVIRAYDAVATEQSAAAMAVSPTVAQPVSESSGGWILKILVVLAVVAVAFVVWRIVQDDEAPFSLSTVTAPVEPGVRPATEEPIPVTTAEPVTEEPGTQLPSEQGASEPTPVSPAEPAPAARDASQVAATPGVISGEASADSGPTEPSTSVDEAATADTAAPATPGTLVFVFKQDSWLEVRDADGRRLAYELGRRGSRRTITGREPFQVFLGFWPAVELTYDGVPVNIPESARWGDTARFSVPAAADN